MNFYYIYMEMKVTYGQNILKPVIEAEKIFIVQEHSSELGSYLELVLISGLK